jgi:tetratricopeptide (TPR) repeat protein
MMSAPTVITDLGWGHMANKPNTQRDFYGHRTPKNRVCPFLLSLKVYPFVFLCFLCAGCHPNSHLLEPDIRYFPQQNLVEQLCPAFEPLSPEELSQDWGKELYLGLVFAREMDLYRALTCFKRALLLTPREIAERRLQIEYNIVFCYYLGHKYLEAIDAFEAGDLINAPEGFPAFQDLLVILYDSYLQLDRPEKAYRLLCLLSAYDTTTASNLTLEKAICEGNIISIPAIAESLTAEKNVSAFLTDYHMRAKSVSRAQTLNAILPGAGFYYVGQTKSALTSFVINALFIAAAYQFFERGYIPAGVLTTSFEMGWYFGGINGAGLAAKEYNEQLYNALGKEMMIQNRLFPILMLQKGF